MREVPTQSLRDWPAWLVAPGDPAASLVEPVETVEPAEAAPPAALAGMDPSERVASARTATVAGTKNGRRNTGDLLFEMRLPEP